MDKNDKPGEEIGLLKSAGYARDESQEKQTSEGGHRDTIKGILLTLICILCTGGTSTCAQLLQREVPDFELSTMRFGSSYLLFSVVLVLRRKVPVMPTCELLGLGLLCVLGFGQITAFYISVSLIPLTYFKSIYFTVNIFSGLVLFPLILKEKADIKGVLLALFCIAGVVLSIQPEFIFTWKNHTTSTLEPEHQTELFNTNTTNSDELIGSGKTGSGVTGSGIHMILGCVLAVVTGLGDTLQIVLLKWKPFLNENLLVVQFWVLTVCTITSAVLMVIFENPVWPQTLEDKLYVVIHCVCFNICWPSFILATRYISGNTMNIIYSSLVILMLIPQYTILSHILPGNKNWIEVLGTVLVFLGAIAGSVLEVCGPRKNI